MPIQFPAKIQLSDLEGKNGFKINGIAAGDESGFSVARAGDINDDGIADLIIGAPYAPENNPPTGETYVIFGGPNVGSLGIVELSELNGINGFQIDGGNSITNNGWSVATAGDINNDGITDLIIGAPKTRVNQFYIGSSYVIFGSNTGFYGTIQVLTLNGKNGFALNGDYSDDGYVLFGNSVALAGDVNADGIADVIVGAPGSVQSYVIFGATNIGNTGNLNISSLNGNNGFMLNGDLKSGYSVSTAGDINGDGVDDIIIGAPYAGPNGELSGQSYVVFGGSSIGNSGTIELSDLNGSNGFKINGVAAPYMCGTAVSNTGDINGDGFDDVIIGAQYYSRYGVNSGQSYVIFGGKNTGNTGTIELSALNSTIGFTLNAIIGSNHFRAFVATAGDFNGDGFADMVLGSPYTGPNGYHSGQSYIVFGNANIGNSSVIELSGLDGMNGIVIDGIAGDNVSGWSVSQAGDVNNDGAEDIIIGAYKASPDGLDGCGQSYVLFGDYLNLMNNNLAIYQDKTIIISQNNLNATSAAFSPNTLQFTISDVQHGQFELIANPSIPITQFYQQDINENKIQFVQDGTIYSPAYKVSIATDGRWAKTVPEAAVIDFTPCLIQVEKNELTLTQGEIVTLTTNNLYAKTTYCSEDDLQFIISNIQHGHFEYTLNPNHAITNFYQQNITDGLVQFAQDWSKYAPTYTISAFTGGSVHTTPEIADIHFAPLMLVNNALTITQNGNQVFSSTNLYAEDNVSNNQIVFTIEGLQYGWFEDISSTGIMINQFTQQQIIDGQIQFIQDGTPHLPKYNVIASDGTYTLPPASSNVTLYYLPVLEVNILSIDQGQTIVLNQDNLQATDQYIAADKLIFSITALEHGQFAFITDPKVAINEFTQAQLDAITVSFAHDGSNIPPSYNVSVKAANLASVPQAALINWKPNQPPSAAPKILINNTGRNVLIGSLAAVGVLSSLVVSYIAMGFLKNRRLNATAKDKDGEQKHFYQNVIIPIAKAIFKQIKITGFMNYISSDQMEAYVSAIATIINQITHLGIDIDIQHMSPEQSTELLTQITRQMKHHLNIQKNRCDRAWFTSFFKPQITPEQITQKARVIAKSVHDALLGENDAGIINLPANVDLMDVVGKEPASGEFTTNYIRLP